MWWYYPAGQLKCSTAALSLPSLKEKGGENMEKGLRVEIRTERSILIIVTGKIDSS